MIQRRIDELKMRRALEIEHASDFGLANSLSYAIAELEKIQRALLLDVVGALEASKIRLEYWSKKAGLAGDIGVLEQVCTVLTKVKS